MTYRDEDDAAVARIARLETELAEARLAEQGMDVIAALHREADELVARREELEAERSEIAKSGPRAAKFPRRAYAAIVVSCLTALSSIYVSPERAGMLVVALLLAIVSAGVVMHAIYTRWRAGSR